MTWRDLAEQFRADLPGALVVGLAVVAAAALVMSMLASIAVEVLT